jgi:hypothetical protein
MARMADTPATPCRRFQFRLRTLLIVVTLLAIPFGYVGWQAKIVRDRKAMLETGDLSPVFSAEIDETKDAAIPTIRLWLGDHFCREVFLKQPEDIERYKAAFPEADFDTPAPEAPVR